MAIKLWKPCSEAKNSHPEGGERGGGGPPLVALAGTAVYSHAPEMEESIHFDQMCSFLQVSVPIVAEKLNQAALPIVDFQTCSKPAYWWDVLRPSMMCAGYKSPDVL